MMIKKTKNLRNELFSGLNSLGLALFRPYTFMYMVSEDIERT